jgi:hypothetical protein
MINSTAFNPLAIVATMMADWNAVLPDFYYVRPAANPPTTTWGIIFGFVYNVYWKQFIWTWEPFDSFFKYNIKAAEATGNAGASWTSFF